MAANVKKPEDFILQLPEELKSDFEWNALQYRMNGLSIKDYSETIFTTSGSGGGGSTGVTGDYVVEGEDSM